jgi:AcrR family transcriptional regulator
MSRPPKISEEEILAAARVVFLAKGIAATAADVAARCGVGEATIFRRFPTKYELFRAAVTLDGHPPWMETLAERAGRGEPRETLAELGAEIMAYARKLLPSLMMSISNPVVTEFERGRSLRLGVLEALTGFFTAEIRAGRVQVGEPHVAAHIFLGAIVNFVLSEMLHTGSEKMSQDAFLEELAGALCKRAEKGKTGKTR